jgi:alkylhydroperoxidase family enzyme
LGRREREVLARATSEANGAAYSASVHAGLLDELGGRHADDEPLEAFARRVTLHPSESADAIEALREHLTDDQTSDALLVVSLLNLANRQTLGTAITTADDL